MTNETVVVAAENQGSHKSTVDGMSPGGRRKRKKKVSMMKLMGSQSRVSLTISNCLCETMAQGEEENDVDVKPLHKFPTVEEDWDSWFEGAGMKSRWNKDFNTHRLELLERQSALFDGEGQMSPGGAEQMIETVGQTVKIVSEVIEETKLIDFDQKIMETLHPFDRTRLTNIGAVLFLAGLSLILLGSNDKEDIHFETAMNILRQGVVTDGRRDDGKKVKSKDRGEETEQKN